MAYSNIKLDDSEDIAVLTFDREKHNFLNSETLKEFGEAITYLSSKLPRALIVTGNSNGFIAGLDLKEYITILDQKNKKAEKKYIESLEIGRNAMRMLETLPIPTIAAVNKFAIGGGLEVALCCDMIFGSIDSQYGFPEVKLGIIPGAGGTVLLQEKIGSSNAKSLIFSGTLIGSEKAYNIGIIDAKMPENDLLSVSKKYLQEIIKNPAYAISAAKDAIFNKTYYHEKATFEDLLKSNETKELIRKFLSK